jgi:hypothetical protein
MFLQTWRKYMPVVVLLLKKSSNGQQLLSMNHTDFERAAGGKKIKLTFSELELMYGRINFRAKHTALANDFIAALQENEAAKPIVSSNTFEFSMNTSFQLIIRNTTAETTAENEKAVASEERAL